MRSLSKVPPRIQRLAPRTISRKELSILWQKAQRDFANAGGSLVKRKIDELSERQTLTPLIAPTDSEIKRLGITYLDILRVVAGQFTASLAQTVGRRHYGTQERAWIRKVVRKFIEDRKSKHAALALFAETFGYFSIENKADAQTRLCEIIARPGVGKPLLVHVCGELEFAETQYRGTFNPATQIAPMQEFSPGEKVANPVRYPRLTVPEAMELFGKSRSTIYRWIDESRLQRAFMGAVPGKRSSCLILTASAGKLLKESPE